ncbi:hypothetical protein RINTHH_10880 [Richelia intracellularis HH01]|uniref:Uncharacterized protein n=1 Tax=Richelia intracellularis HH01 TaxID=1165094 RepID=M1X030_9NOST|nr:hypothetical protein RINTHH_10880 [Richelia intracellularis HH01]
MCLAGFNTDSTVPIIAPIPTPTINNRKTYKIVLAIGFKRPFRETLTRFGTPCFLTLIFASLPVTASREGISLYASGMGGGVVVFYHDQQYY